MIRVLSLLLLLLPSATMAQSLIAVGRVIINSDQNSMGGLSGIEMLSEGRFLAISDRGNFFEGIITRSDDKIDNVVFEPSLPILDSKGIALDRRNTDAEGLAVDPNGVIYIAFEGNHRVMRHETVLAIPTFMPKHEDFRSLQNNSGLEALAMSAGGVLVAIPERSGQIDRPFPVYQLTETEWVQTGSIPRDGEFLVTGADFGPDGWFYLLERAYKWPAGFSSRIRRFSFKNGQFTNGQTIFESRTDRLDNMEGISVWKDQTNQIRLTLVSDDNFNRLQRTVIAEYLLQD